MMICTTKKKKNSPADTERDDDYGVGGAGVYGMPVLSIINNNIIS